MGLQTIVTYGVTVGLTVIAALAVMFYQQRRYLTNNPNATNDDFHVYGNSTCSICLGGVNAESDVILNCGHVLHQACLDEMNQHAGYLQVSRCPVCRTPIRS